MKAAIASAVLAAAALAVTAAAAAAVATAAAAQWYYGKEFLVKLLLNIMTKYIKSLADEIIKICADLSIIQYILYLNG